MVQLRHDYEQFVDANTEVVAIGPDNAESFKDYWEKENMPFYGIPDEQHRVLDLYGQKVNLLKLGRMPAQVVIDKEGILKYVHYGSSMKDIPENEEVLAVIKSL